VILAEHLVKPLGAVPSIEGLVGGHRRRCYRWARRARDPR
jgi:hypothetical protein